MRVKIENLKELLNIYYSDNYTQFAREYQIDASQFHHFIKTGKGGGKKIIGAIIKFCKQKNIDFEDYIEL